MIKQIVVAVALASVGVAAADPKTDALVESAKQDYVQGNYHAALHKLEQALHGQPTDPQIIALAYFSACRAHSFDHAKALFARLSPGRQSQFVQICLAEHFDPR